MTAPIEHRNNHYMMLVEELRLRRADKWSDPEHGQLVPLDTLDRAILAIVELGFASGHITDADVRRFDEAWHDK